MHIDSMRPSDFDEVHAEDGLILGNPTPVSDAPQGSSDAALVAGLSDGSDDDDDVFAESRPGSAAGGMAELSELPRLQREHATNGYRDGVTAAKATSIQAGFDEGFKLGATFGAVVGRLLGVLAGLEEAVAAAADAQHKAELCAVAERAKKELCMERIFAAEYWNGDGTWKYDVVVGEGKTDEDLVFEDVVREHPLVKRWQKEVDAVMERWGVSWEIPGREGDEGRVAEDEETKTEKKLPVRNVAPPTKSKSPLDW